jgi:hypothetical protein
VEIDNFFEAVEKGDSAIVARALKDHRDFLDACRGEEKAIHIAAQSGHSGILQLLLENGADITARCDGKTPLHYAAGSTSEAVQVLIRNGGDLTVVDNFGRTPLVEAVFAQADEKDAIIREMREAGAPYDLTAAASLGDLEGVTAILNGDPTAAATAPFPECNLLSGVLSLEGSLLWGIWHLAGGLVLARRQQILRMLFEHGMKIKPHVLITLADACETSGLTDFAQILRENVHRS